MKKLKITKEEFREEYKRRRALKKKKNENRVDSYVVDSIVRSKKRAGYY